MTKLWQLDIDSPLGPLRLRADGEGFLRSVRFIAEEAAGAGSKAGVMREKDGEPESRESDLAERAAGTLLKAADQLNRFFSGSLEHFDLPLREEKSPFRREVYSALSMTGPGETITYGDLARRVGRPGAGRAVGGALAANELLIILPCHRVVPSSGGCGSYRDGAKRKSALIALEKRHCSAEKAALGDDGASAISSLRNTASAG